MKRLQVVLAFLLYSFILSGQTKDAVINPVPPEVKIAGTQLQHLHSVITGRDYDLQINLPRFYSDTSRTFPVLFLLDSQWDFPLVQGIYGEQYYDGFLPEMLIVGITWGGNNPNYDSLRAADFVPYNNPEILQSGNAPNFLKFIKEELIPFVEKNYRVKKDDRALMGSSFGGLFTLYTMFTEADLFDKYIMTSPAIGWDESHIYKTEKEFSQNNKSLPAKVYMTIGDYEDFNGLQNFIDSIKSRNYNGLQLETSILKNMGHSGTKSVGYTRGLQFAYKRPAFDPDQAVLDKYAGFYANQSGMKVEIKTGDKKLLAVMPNGEKINFSAINNSDFQMTGSYLFIHFITDKTGNVAGFNLSQFGGDTFMEKLNEKSGLK